MYRPDPNFIVPTAPPGTNNNQAASTAFVLANIGGGININTLSNAPFVTDGLTSNVPMFQSLALVLQSVNKEMPVPVNITIGTPTVLSLNPTVMSGGTQPNPVTHYLKPNQAFYFIQTGAGTIPNGITLNTPYYIRAGIQGVDGLTATTFTFSTTNNYGLLPSGFAFTSEGSAVNTTGSFTGTFSIVLTGRDVSVFIPPGPYFGGNYADAIQNVTVTPNGMTRVRYYADDAIFDTKTCLGAVGAGGSFMHDARTWAVPSFDLVNTTPNDNFPLNVDGSITLQTPAHAANYYKGQWISVFGLNIQDPLGAGVSGPPNLQYHEFKQIKSINVGAGILTLDGPLKWVYLSTFPQLFAPNSVFVAGGAASISPMHPAWDCDIEIHGARWIGQPGLQSARRILFNECTFQGYANDAAQTAPSISQSYIFRRCTFGPSGLPGQTYMEVDKMLEYLELDNCVASNQYRILFSSPSLHVCKIKGLKGARITGTPRQIAITDSEPESLLIGPFIGVTDACVVQNTQTAYFDMLGRNDDPFDLFTLGLALSTSNDMTLVPNWTFSNGTFTRNLSGLPGQQALNWSIPGAKLYMIDAGGVFNAGQNMGSPFTILNVTLSGSNLSFDTTLSAIPTRQTSHTVTITIASPGVFTWAAHGLAAGTPIVLTTTGALPTGLSISTPYYVTNDGNLAANTFAVSSTRAGALAGTGQINTSGTQSGTHTAYGNPLCFRPHPCARFTSIGNRGCTTIIDQNGTIDEPLFTRVKRAFVGKQSNGNNSSALQIPNPRIWGFLKSMTVNVRKAGTASGTLTISCPGFTQPNLALSNFSQVIDTATAGVRSWTGSAAPTGSAGADTIVAYADWIAGPLLFTWSSAGVTLPNSPVVEFEIITDQGITKFGNMMGMPVAGTNLWEYIDSGINQQYGATP